jgi:hypothetical protein
MDPRERQPDLEELHRISFERGQARLWTVFPAIVQAVTNNGLTCEVQPAVNGRVRQQDETWKPIQLPKLVDVPIQWPQGGGVTFTFPLKAGVDEVIVAVSARCIDTWFQQGWTPPAGQLGADGKAVNTANNPTEWRMHNLSDGFAIPGIRSRPRALSPAPSTTSAQIRTDDGTAYFDFNPTTKAAKLTMPGGINLNGVTIDSNGNLTSPATIVGTTEVVAKTGGSAVHLSTHTHGGVQTGTGNSGAPNGGT